MGMGQARAETFRLCRNGFADNYRVRTDFGKFWKDMEIDNAFFQDLKKVLEERTFQNGYGKALNFYLENF